MPDSVVHSGIIDTEGRTIRSFAPVSRSDANILILGSMPGNKSLQASEYYAHPRNLFWDIMQTVLGIPRSAQYPHRLEQLKEHRIALWDVAFECERRSSLDSDIVGSSVEPNDFASFFSVHADIRRICLNGNKAAELFARHVQKRLPQALELDILTLPSTSPANAAMSREQKLNAWRQALSWGDRSES